MLRTTVIAAVSVISACAGAAQQSSGPEMAAACTACATPADVATLTTRVDVLDADAAMLLAPGTALLSFDPSNIQTKWWNAGGLDAPLAAWIDDGWDIESMTGKYNAADRVVAVMRKTPGRKSAFVQIHPDNGRVYGSHPAGPGTIQEWIAEGWRVIAVAGSQANDRMSVALVK